MTDEISELVEVVDSELNKNGGESVAPEVKANVPLVEAARSETIQSLDDAVSSGGGFRDFAFLYQASETLPPWWSSSRDDALSEFWKSVNLLAGAMYTMTSKLTTIPFHVEPRDPAITAHFKNAAKFEKRLHESAEFGEGWMPFFAKQLQSLLGQDNGRFMEIIDFAPNKNGPIIGAAVSVAHLDPSRCQRTGDKTYPVLYHNTDGSLRKLHWTRVAFNAQLPSERRTMLGIGFSAVSRCTSYAQNILDITTYKQEKLGSRPKRGMLIVGGGLDAEAIGLAMQASEAMADSSRLKRFAPIPIVGEPSIEAPTVELVEFSQLPDGFSEQDATDIAMAAIALGFGTDARELWPNAQKGATRADALLSHIKQRGKGAGQIILQTEQMFNNWFLPPYLKMVFDYQDDAQDRQRAEIRRERSLTRKNDIGNGVTDDRTERERMVKEGELSTAQFAALELRDGRLPNGKPLETLFYSDDRIYVEILSLGVTNPLDILANEPEGMLKKISTQKTVAYEVIARETGEANSRRAKQSLAALESLEQMYQEVLFEQQQQELDESVQDLPSEGRQGVREGPKSNAEDESAINVRPDDEAGLSEESNPRELTGKDLTVYRDKETGMFGIFKKKKKDTVGDAMDDLKKAIDDNRNESPTLIQITPQINIDMPEVEIPKTEVTVNVPDINVPPAEVTVNVPESPTPQVHVKSPDVVVNVPETKTESDDKKEISDTEVIKLERDNFGAIVGLERRRKKGDK